MDRSIRGSQGRCVVVHRNPLVAEDLRQLLLSEGASEVVVCASLRELPSPSASVAFVEGAASQLKREQAVLDWIATKTPVIAMNGSKHGCVAVRGLHVLEQPFRSEDVVALLNELQVF